MLVFNTCPFFFFVRNILHTCVCVRARAREDVLVDGAKIVMHPVTHTHAQSDCTTPLFEQGNRVPFQIRTPATECAWYVHTAASRRTNRALSCPVINFVDHGGCFDGGMDSHGDLTFTDPRCLRTSSVWVNHGNARTATAAPSAHPVVCRL